MLKRASGGFTLVEILLVVGLVGIIAAAALAPLVFTVRSLGDAQKDFSASAKERSAMDGIFLDLRSAIANPAFASVKTVHKEGLSVQADDRLLVWSATPARESRPVGLVVYRLVAPSILEKDVKQGLYRWVITDFTSDKAVSDDTPMELDTDTLDTKKGRMVLAGATGVSFSVWSGEDWSEEYEGSLPRAFKAVIKTKDKSFEYEEWFPAIPTK